jgi:hypothetical protein
MRRIYHLLLSCLPASWALSVIYFRAHGRWPNLRSPKTFNEKIQYRKLHQHDKRFSRLADKSLVKEYVAEKLGPDWVIPTLWVGTELPPLAERTWEMPFALKATHGSSTNVFVRNTAERNWPVIEQKADAWLHQTYGTWAREWLYTKIQPRLLVEPFINFGSALPLDYKFFVFEGRVAYIQVDTDREHDHRRILYTRDWQLVDVRFGVDRPATLPPRPTTLEAMIAAAEQLGSAFDFVRIDFYEVQGRPLFGEMTFYPDSGLGTFTPSSFDTELGALWRLQ